MVCRGLEHAVYRLAHGSASLSTGPQRACPLVCSSDVGGLLIVGCWARCVALDSAAMCKAVIHVCWT